MNYDTKDDTSYGDSFIDRYLIQQLQNEFCDANSVYMVCAGKRNGSVTEIYGTKAERNWLAERIDEKYYSILTDKLYSSAIEDVAEEVIDQGRIKICAVAIRVNQAIVAVWLVAGILREKEDVSEPYPEYMMTTTEERLDKTVKFLAIISRQFFAAKMDEAFAQEAFSKSIQERKRTEEELRRNETMTAIVQQLGSEEPFTVISEKILQGVCDFLQVNHACLLQLNKSTDKVDIICEYTDEPSEAWKEKGQGILVENLPFLTGKPFIISSDVPLPAKFQPLFEKTGIRAAITFPIEVNHEFGMYACFCETKKERVWDAAEVKFINDSKQVIQSILTKRITKNSLTSSYASLEAILENVGCAIYVVDPVTKQTLYTNQQFHEMFPKPNDVEEFQNLLREEYTGMESGKSNEVYSDLEKCYYDIFYTKIHWVNGREVLLCTIYNVTDKKLYQQKIERQANNDFLTGLYNRMRCEQDLEEYIRKTKEAGGQGALLYIDLDDFKHINDGLGHQYGDVLLKAISHSLQRITGIETTCYRMGGDEFIIIVSHYYYNMLAQILDEIRNIFTKPWFLKGADYYCTMSMGVVCFPKDGENVQDLIKKADIALYEAKEAGKNRIEFYDETVEVTSIKRLELEKNMHAATIDSCKEFEVYYQPIIDITGSKAHCVGAEALIRWNSETMGFVSPSEFIPLAEYLGLINPIGNFILEEACRRCKYWNDMGHPEYRINVNLSVVQLLQNDMVDHIRKVIKDTKIKPTNLTLEVTESLAINDMARMKRVLAQIKQLGVWVALDDFGTGYSSLNHIRELPIDIIKIDRCFVIDIGKDDYSEVFVKMVSELADTIGVKMCVEGVEKDEQLNKLKQMKVQYIQGFYYDRPMRASDFEDKYL